MNKEQIINELQKRKEIVEGYGHTIFFIALYGSQNYGLATENSDIDCKAIVIPTTMNIIMQSEPVFCTIKAFDNELIEVMDVRHFFKKLTKQHPNYLEILYTDYMIVNEDYSDIMDALLRNRDSIVQSNIFGTIGNIVGNINGYRGSLFHRKPSNEKDYDRCGYAPKDLMHMYRLLWFLNDFLAGKPYKDCLLNETNVKWLLEVKAGEIPCSEVHEIAKGIDDRAMDIKKEYMKTHENVYDEWAYQQCQTFLYRILSRRIKKEICEGCDLVG